MEYAFESCWLRIYGGDSSLEEYSTWISFEVSSVELVDPF